MPPRNAPAGVRGRDALSGDFCGVLGLGPGLELLEVLQGAGPAEAGRLQQVAASKGELRQVAAPAECPQLRWGPAGAAPRALAQALARLPVPAAPRACGGVHPGR